MQFIQKHIVISSTVAGFVLTLLSLFIVNVSSINIDVFYSINLPISSEDAGYPSGLCNGIMLQEDINIIENRGLLTQITHKSIVNDGCSSTYVKSYELYPLGFIVNWLIYSSLVGAGLVAYKKIRT